MRGEREREGERERGGERERRRRKSPESEALRIRDKERASTCV